MTPAEIAKLTVPKLKAELNDRGLDDTGLKKVLVERLTAALAEPAAAAAPAAPSPAKAAAPAKRAREEPAAAPAAASPKHSRTEAAAAEKATAAAAAAAAMRSHGKQPMAAQEMPTLTRGPSEVYERPEHAYASGPVQRPAGEVRRYDWGTLTVKQWPPARDVPPGADTEGSVLVWIADQFEASS